MYGPPDPPGEGWNSPDSRTGRRVARPSPGGLGLARLPDGPQGRPTLAGRVGTRPTPGRAAGPPDPRREGWDSPDSRTGRRAARPSPGGLGLARLPDGPQGRPTLAGRVGTRPTPGRAAGPPDPPGEGWGLARPERAARPARRGLGLADPNGPPDPPGEGGTRPTPERAAAGWAARTIYRTLGRPTCAEGWDSPDPNGPPRAARDGPQGRPTLAGRVGTRPTPERAAQVGPPGTGRNGPQGRPKRAARPSPGGWNSPDSRR